MALRIIRVVLMAPTCTNLVPRRMLSNVPIVKGVSDAAAHPEGYRICPHCCLEQARLLAAKTPSIYMYKNEPSYDATTCLQLNLLNGKGPSITTLGMPPSLSSNAIWKENVISRDWSSA
eukprot:CAMPEP_0179470816 /NCGR_PEP_ID=MMETSP0799-20121207/51176_1 /TAXON_ID=46947 /ORGANISM="Geminigera cryophila, Strain CCMP2564" /LENGTH=118 /DNA_ID=CAMNT_0021278065 /DNA_START=881 /DNA_END=1237 /DNA_ORIENTATION=-